MGYLDLIGQGHIPEKIWNSQGWKEKQERGAARRERIAAKAEPERLIKAQKAAGSKQSQPGQKKAPLFPNTTIGPAPKTKGKLSTADIMGYGAKRIFQNPFTNEGKNDFKKARSALWKMVDSSTVKREYLPENTYGPSALAETRWSGKTYGTDRNNNGRLDTFEVETGSNPLNNFYYTLAKPAAVAAKDSLISGGNAFNNGVYSLVAGVGDYFYNLGRAGKAVIDQRDLNAKVELKTPLGNSAPMQYIRNNANAAAAQANQSAQHFGAVGEFANQITQSVSQMAPSLIAAYLTAGQSASGDLARAGMTTLEKAVGMLKLPKHMIPTFLSQAGQSYNDALEQTGDPVKALGFGIANGYANALIEQGGVQEGVASGAIKDTAKHGAWNFVKNNMLEEGAEEITQNWTEKGLRKMMMDSSAPMFANSDENAVINPKRDLYSGAVGAAAGGLFGGANAAVNHLANVQTSNRTEPLQQRLNYAEEKAPVQTIQQEVIDNLVNDTIEQAPQDINRVTDSFDKQPIKKDMEVIKREYAGAVDNGLVKFTEYTNNNPDDNRTTYSMSEVSERAVEDIKRLTGIDTDGFEHSIKTNSIRHIEKNHGINGKTDHSMADVNDIARMQYVIDNYDTVEFLPENSKEHRDKNQKPAPMVRYVKRVNGNYYVVEAVPDTKKHQLVVVTAYKNKASQQERNGNNTPTRNARNVTTDIALSTDSIPQNGENVNMDLADSESTGSASFMDENGGTLANERLETQTPIHPVKILDTDTGPVRAAKQVMNILSDRYGVQFETFQGDSKVNGKYDPTTKTIYINENSNSPMLYTVSHEFLHSFKDTDLDGYQLLKNVVASDMNLVKFNEYKKAMLESYEEIGIDYSKLSSDEINDLVLEESMSDLMTEVMRDPATIERIATENRNLAQKIMDGLTKIINDIKEAISKYFGSGNKEVQELVYHFEKVKDIYQEVLTQSDGTVQVSSGRVQYSVKYDGRKPTVVIEDDIFAGHEGEKPHKVIRDYIKNHYSGDFARIIESGQKVYFGKDLPGEYTQSVYTQKLRPGLQKAKGQATQNLNELVEIGTNRTWNKNAKEKHKLDAKYGWYKYTTRFQVKDKTYTADVLIRNDADGKKYLYDVQNIKREGQGSSSSSSQNGSDVFASTSPSNMNTISQNQDSVNSSISDSEQTDTKKSAINLESGERGSVVRRKEKAEEALRRFEESGNMDDLPERSWAKTYKRAADKRNTFLKNQISTLEFNLENEKNADKRAALNDMLKKAREKQAEAQSNYKVSEQLMEKLDDLQNAQSATAKQWEGNADFSGLEGRASAQRNFDLAEIADKLHDADKHSIKNGNYRFNDIYRNMKRVFGEHFGIAEPTLGKFDVAKGDYAREIIEILTEMKQYVVKGLGIKKGSKESKAVQWIAEGERRPNIWKRKDREALQKMGVTDVKNLDPNITIPYTEQMLVEDFGADRAREIKKAAEWFRGKYDELIDDINSTQRISYPNRPDKLIPKRKDYMRHFQEVSEGLAGLRNIFSTDNNIDPTLVSTSEHTKPKEKFASIKQKRSGKATKEGAIEGFLDYLPQAEYAIHINPYIDQFRGLARDLAQIKSEQNDTSLNGFIGYLYDYASDLAGKSSKLDRAMIDFLGAKGRTAIRGLRWFNNRTKSNAVLGNLGSVAKQIMNLPNGMVLLDNPANILPGIFDVFRGFRDGGKVQENYSKSNFLTERLGIERAFGKFDKMGPWKIAQELLGIGDEFGTRAIWNAAYRDGVKLEKSGDITNAAKYADNLTRKAVAGRGIGETPLAYKSELGRLALPFQIEVGNTWNVVRDVLQTSRHDGKLKSVKNFGDKTLRVLLFYLVTWGMSEALKALTGSKGSFDPLGDIVDGFKQGSEELPDKPKLEQVQRGGLRAVQNIAGDFIGNRSFGWAVSSFMDALNDDWTTEFFNDSIYPSQGVNVPALQSVQKGAKKFIDGDWVGGTTELATSFLTPWGGKQLDKTVRGLGDYARGGNYQNNIYKELSTREHGNKYYEIEQTPINAIKSAVFGPSSLGENDEYWKTKKLESYAQKEERKFKEKSSRKFVQQIEHNNLSSDIIQFYKDEEVAPKTASKKVKYKDKEYNLTEVERQQYQDAIDKETLELITAISKSNGYSNLSNEDKIKQIKAVGAYAEAVAKNEVLKKKDSSGSITFFKQDIANKQKYYSIWDEVEPNNVEKQARGKAIGEVSSVVNALSKKSKLTPAVISGINKYVSEIENRKPNAVDKELHRLGVLREDYTDTENGDMDVSRSYMTMFEYTDEEQKYVVNVRYSDMPQIMREVEKETYRQMERLLNNQYQSQKKKTYGQRYNYKNANADQKIKWVNEVRTDVKNEFKSKYSRKYGVTKVVNKLKAVK